MTVDALDSASFSPRDCNRFTGILPRHSRGEWHGPHTCKSLVHHGTHDARMEACLLVCRSSVAEVCFLMPRPGSINPLEVTAGSS